MFPENRTPIHPGEILREEDDSLGMCQVASVIHVGVPLQRVNEIVRSAVSLLRQPGSSLTQIRQELQELGLRDREVRQEVATGSGDRKSRAENAGIVAKKMN